ncbi:MAG: PepSY-associated TM helix domain-containing protein [Mycobacteriaceae bacterium]
MNDTQDWTESTTATGIGKDKQQKERKERSERGRLIRRVWRMHFYAGAIAGPFLLLLSLTGLVILYTQPIQSALHSDLITVNPGSTSVPLSTQVDAALYQFPDHFVRTVTPAAEADQSTLVALGIQDSSDTLNVYVNPYTGNVLGSDIDGSDVVGLSNRLHGFLNNEAITVTLPSLSHWIDADEHPESTVTVALGSLIIEIITVWSLVLALTGIYLWWPRSSQKGKPAIRVRWGKGGRIRWQDLHSLSGLLVASVLAIFVISGMPWSQYWGSDWSTVASKITPNKEPSPVSTVAKVGDVDRLGHHIEWSTQTDNIPTSPTLGAAAELPAQISYTSIATIAEQEGMLAGYSIIPPMNIPGADEAATYGSFIIMNHWPQKLSEQRTLYLDQFTGNTLANSTADDKGFLNKATSFGVNLHMGTQYGLLTRILATTGCLLLILSVLTSYLMWWKRRPSKTVGLPNRPNRRPGTRSVGTPAMTIIGLTLALIYPSFGVSLLLVVLLDTAVKMYTTYVKKKPANSPT